MNKTMEGQLSIFDFPEVIPEEDFETMTIERAAELVGGFLGLEFQKDESHYFDSYSARTRGFYITIGFSRNYKDQRILDTQVDYKSGGYGNPALSIDDCVNSIKAYMRRSVKEQKNE